MDRMRAALRDLRYALVERGHRWAAEAVRRLADDLDGLVPTAFAVRFRSLVAALPAGVALEQKGAALLAWADWKA